jgi:hypothetical protein
MDTPRANEPDIIRWRFLNYILGKIALLKNSIASMAAHYCAPTDKSCDDNNELLECAISAGKKSIANSPTSNDATHKSSTSDEIINNFSNIGEKTSILLPSSTITQTIPVGINITEQEKTEDNTVDDCEISLLEGYFNSSKGDDVSYNPMLIANKSAADINPDDEFDEFVNISISSIKIPT